MKATLLLLFLIVVNGKEACNKSDYKTFVSLVAYEIEEYYLDWLKDMKFIGDYISQKESRGSFDILEWYNNSNVYSDVYKIDPYVSTNNTCWGDLRPTRIAELFIPYFAETSIVDYSATPPVNIPSPLLASQYCRDYYPEGYQPLFCRNGSLFQDNMINFDLSVFISSIDILSINKHSRGDELSSIYLMTARGLTTAVPVLNTTLVSLRCDNHIIDIINNSKVNNANDAYFVSPRIENGSNIITAIQPVYFGYLPYIYVSSDINMFLIKDKISSLKPTQSTFSILVDENGSIILGEGFNVLFEESIETTIEKTPFRNFFESNFDTQSLWQAAKSSLEIQEDSVSINGTKYYVVFKTFGSLKDWVLFTFSKEQELEFNVSVDLQRKTLIASNDSHENITKTFIIQNNGLQNLTYTISLPEYINLYSTFNLNESKFEILDPNEILPGLSFHQITAYFNTSYLLPGTYDSNLEIKVADSCYQETFFIFTKFIVKAPSALLTVTHSASIVILFISILSLILPIVYIVGLLKYGHHSTLSSISPTFFAIALLGSVMCQLSPIFLTIYAQNCNAWWWLVSIGWITFQSCILVKTYRIAKIFLLGKRLKTARKLKNKNILPAVGVLISIQILLCILLTVFAPLKIRIVPYNSITNKTICVFGEENALAGIILFGLQALYFCIFMIVGCYYSFRTRNFYKKEYTESKEILFATYNSALVLLLMVVVVAGTNITPDANLLFIGLCTIISSLVCMNAFLLRRLYTAVMDLKNPSDEESKKSHSKDSPLTVTPSQSIQSLDKILNTS